MNETRKSIAEPTIFHKMQRLTSLIFDNQESVDKFISVIECLFNEKGKNDYSFSGEIKRSIQERRLFKKLKTWQMEKQNPKVLFCK